MIFKDYQINTYYKYKIYFIYLLNKIYKNKVFYCFKIYFKF